MCVLEARPADQHQVAGVDEEPHALSEDEDGIFPVNRVGEQCEGTAQAEEPERDRHDALFVTLRIDPLHEEAGREEGLAEEADDQPQSGSLRTILEEGDPAGTIG